MFHWCRNDKFCWRMAWSSEEHLHWCSDNDHWSITTSYCICLSAHDCCACLSGSYQTWDLTNDLQARIVSGVGMGFINSTVPVMMAEFAPKATRGIFVCAQLSTLSMI